MKKIIIAILILITIPCFYILGKHFWRGELMSPSKVCKKWGIAPLDIERFRKTQDISVRASMTCSLLKEQKKFIGKDPIEIREIFGNFDGFYFSEFYPTYMIESDDIKETPAWQIVFLIDRKQKISEIVVHKNCCD